MLADPLIAEYLDNLRTQNPQSAQTIRFYMLDFDQFLKRKLGLSNMEELVKGIKAGKLDVYEVLRRYTSYLLVTKMEKGQISAKTLGYKVKYAKRLLEFLDVDITPSKFRIKVKLPKNVDGEKTPLDKNMVRTILQACDDPRLRSFILWLASSGWRAKESLSLKLENIDFTTDPITVHVHGRYTKTRKSRHSWLTREMATELNEYLNLKYRPRTINYNYDRITGKYEKKSIIPERKPTDYIFLPYHLDSKDRDNNPRNLDFAYARLHERFATLLKRLGIGWENESKKRKKVTFHSFRRLVYTNIESLGLNQFAEFYIGHHTSEYWAKPETEKIATFKKVEPYLIYHDVATLEAKGVDNQTRIDQLQAELQQERLERQKLYQMLYERGIIKNPKGNRYGEE